MQWLVDAAFRIGLNRTHCKTPFRSEIARLQQNAGFVMSSSIHRTFEGGGEDGLGAASFHGPFGS